MKGKPSVGKVLCSSGGKGGGGQRVFRSDAARLPSSLKKHQQERRWYEGNPRIIKACPGLAIKKGGTQQTLMSSGRACRVCTG